MQYPTHRSRHWMWALAALLSLLLGACGPKNADATPTLSVDAIFTAAFQTLSAQQATQLALIPPTNTPAPSPTVAPATIAPLPSPLATLAFSTPVTGGGGASVCDNSAFVSDVTIPDNTVMDPGKKFTKTWALLNNGTCTWSTSYKLGFDSGEQMGGATSTLTVAVAPGSTANISVSMVAPSNSGTYTGTWRMQNASGQKFGAFPYVKIKVGSGSTATAGPSPTPGAGTYTISGSLGVVGATINFSNADSEPSVSYSGDNYSFLVPSGWSGTIIPSKGKAGKWVFSPINETFNNVTKNMTQNFTAESVDKSPTPTP